MDSKTRYIVIAVVAIVVVLGLVLLMRRRHEKFTLNGQIYPAATSPTGAVGALPGTDSATDAGTIAPSSKKVVLADDLGNLHTATIPMPIGVIVMWSGTAAKIPDGWGLCDGTVQNGIKTPDLRGRFIVGASNVTAYNQATVYNAGSGALDITSTSQYVFGNFGGEEYHQLTQTEMPSHRHTQNLAFGACGGQYPYEVPYGNSSNGCISYTLATGGDTNNTSVTVPHNNLPPYYALCFIMRIV